jgi:hypothetical protein
VEVVAFAAAASLPALRLGQGDKVALRVRLPEAAGRGQVFKEGANTLLALPYWMQAERRGFAPFGVDGAIQVLAVYREVCPFRAVAHGNILTHSAMPYPDF